MVAVAIGLFFFNSTVMVTEIKGLEESRAARDSELKSLKGEATKALEETTKFTNQLIQTDAIAELEERRRDQSRLFDSVAGEVINQASWLTGLSHQRGVLTIQGLATDHEVVAAFLSKLERSPLLNNPELIRAVQDKTINGVRLVTFEIRGSTVFPQSTLMVDGLPDVDLPGREEITRIVSSAAPGLGENLTKSREAQAASL
jgi:Tfp pilus assembly protein PilN